MSTLTELMEIAYNAALEAGREILDVYEGSDFDVEMKADDSPLTVADKRAHDSIVRALEKSGLPVLSEEGADIPVDERRGWERYWLVDPLDGTKEFIKRNGEFTVNIALMAKSPQQTPHGGPGNEYVPAAGVVYVPVKDIAYLGVGGRGAWKVENALIEALKSELQREESDPAYKGRNPVGIESVIGSARGLPVDDPASRPFSAVMSRSHNSPETEEYVSRLEETYGTAERVSSGSSIKLCLVAEGTADVYPRFAPTMEWDTAAGDAVCRAAGCRVTGKDEVTPLAYNKEDLHNPWFVVLGPRLAGGGPAEGGISGGDRSGAKGRAAES